MKQSFTIPGRLPGLNQYQNACRTHPKKGAEMKRQSQKDVGWCIRAARLLPYRGAVRIHYTFYEMPNRGKMRDKSNIAGFGVKVIEDALQELGIIKNDNWEYMAGYGCDFFKVTENPRIEVEIDNA